ncbi:cell division protein ZapA [Rhodoferax sp. PAMC 29310]|uniref:cell division protein ZapA n=1 Tax=Rhodoferax sp. PAMC 29310 TaxID=2822760 RepID=UPI001B336040|nr:cell division protein ZapA [Rhodoferax sp. PAMC 29310]
MKQIEVQIMGQNYILGCPEGADARLLDAVERLDTAMNQIRDAGKVRARDRIAVLAALNLTFDMVDSTKAATPTKALTGESTAAGADPKLSAILERLDDALNDESQLF